MEKKELIEKLIRMGYLESEKVIDAFRKVPRENFVLPNQREQAYWDVPLPIKQGQTISQPLTVAFMTELLDVKEGMKILEVGAGSGYQAAILSHLVGEKGKVITTEIIPELADFAGKNLRNYKNVEVILWDGSKGYETEAPFDRIILTAAPKEVPYPLREQLKAGGKLVAPVGTYMQTMILIEKTGKNKYKESKHGYFRFVEMK